MPRRLLGSFIPGPIFFYFGYFLPPPLLSPPSPLHAPPSPLLAALASPRAAATALHPARPPRFQPTLLPSGVLAPSLPVARDFHPLSSPFALVFFVGLVVEFPLVEVIELVDLFVDCDFVSLRLISP